MKKSASALVLLLFLSIITVSLPQMGVVKADEDIYIRADGSVGGTDKIQRVGDVYTFTDNIEGSLVVEKDDILIDGRQHTLKGRGKRVVLYGVRLHSRNNVTVKNLTVEGFRWGFHIFGGSMNRIVGCTVQNCYCAIYFFDAPNNMLRNNTFVKCDYGFNIDSRTSSLEDWIQDVDCSNTVDGRPAYYLINEDDVEVPSGAGWIALVNCTGITVQNQNITNNSKGIVLFNTRESEINGNHLMNNLEGIYIAQSSNNSITGNIVTDSLWGVVLGGSKNTLHGNSISNSHKIVLEGMGGGIFVHGQFNHIYGNTITDNENGITIGSGATSNKIFENSILNNEIGFCVAADPFKKEASNNTIYHNSFINNTEQVYQFKGMGFPISVNVWDNGKEGNYWSDYEARYPNASELDGSGVWDTPYVIDENNRDNYPLMAPLVAPLYIFDAGTWEGVSYRVGVVSNSTVSDFSFNPDEGALLRFDVEGEEGTTGFCNVTIPKDLLYTEGNWTVLVDGYSVTPTVNEDTNNTYLYFTYNYNKQTIEIIGTTAIPEFPSWIILPLLLTATALIIICKQKLHKTANQQSY